MAKRRYNAKKIKQAPLLKKTIAILLAEYAPRDPQISLTNMLAFGHRGYISFSEDELCKMFDKVYSQVTEETNARIAKLQADRPSYNWQVEANEENKKELQRLLKQFQNVADEIFEQKVLL
jgi:hypothetical protein